MGAAAQAQTAGVTRPGTMQTHRATGALVTAARWHQSSRLPNPMKCFVD